MYERIPIPKRTRFEVFKRDNFTCQYCGKTKNAVSLEVDHILPVAAGGTNDILNLTTACEDCNAGKGATLLDDQTYVEQARSIENRERAARSLAAIRVKCATLNQSVHPERLHKHQWATEDEDLRWLDPTERREVKS